MNPPRFLGIIIALSLFVLVSSSVLPAENHPIDVNNSRLKVRVFKTGLFSPFAHNHEIEALITEGSADLSETLEVTVRIDARNLQVLDTEVSERDRAEIQKTMSGPSVLDSEQFPDISFHSTRVDQIGADHWKVVGDLALHGRVNPVVVDVAFKDGHYFGSATIRQRDFGITPVSIAGGTVKVKDELKIEFDIALLS